MSAFVVDKRTIDAIVNTIVNGPERTKGGPDGAWYGVYDPDTGELLRFTDADRIGCELWSQNLRSVAYRYPEDVSGSRPGPVGFADEDATNYVAASAPRDPAPAIAKAVHCLQYQSCEDPGWAESWSCKVLDALLSELWRFVPGYDEGEWH